MSGDAHAGRSSLFGLVSFRPRLTVVLIFLTLTVAVVGYHITRDSQVGKAEEVTREALRIFAAAGDGHAAAGTHDPAGIEERIREWVGAKVALPREEGLFSYGGVTRERMGKQPAAAVRLTFDEERCLLVIMKPDPVRGGDSFAALFSGASFLSWEKDGIAFVIWEKEGVRYFLLSEADLTRAFDLVRQYFT